jgi:hypothetical protein
MIGSNLISDTPTSILAGSVRDQLAGLLTAVNARGALALANAWSNSNVFNGLAGDTNAAISTTAVASDYKLLWAIAGSPGRAARLYSMASGALMLVSNAYWSGTQWEYDSPSAVGAVRLTLNLVGRISIDTAPVAANPVVWGYINDIGKYSIEDRDFMSGGVVGATFRTTTATVPEPIIDDGGPTDILAVVYAVVGDVIKAEAGFTCNGASLSASLVLQYSGAAAGDVPGSARRVDVDDEAIRICGEFTVATTGTYTIKPIHSGIGSGTTTYVGEYYIRAEVIRS